MLFQCDLEEEFPSESEDEEEVNVVSEGEEEQNMIKDFSERMENIEIKYDEGKLLFLYAYFYWAFKLLQSYLMPL